MRRLPTIPGSRALLPIAAGMAAVSLIATGCGGGAAESTGASAASVAGFVPASSPLYMEVSTDLDGPQWTQVDTLAKTFPAYPEMRAQLQKDLTSGDVNFDTDVKPLLGDRAAVAAIELPPASSVTSSGSSSGGAASPGALTPEVAAAAKDAKMIGVVDLAEGKDAAAEQFLAKQADGAPTTVDGVKVYKDGDNTVAAVVDGAILFADTRADLKTAIDAHAAGGDKTLAGNDRFTEAIGKLPSDTFAQFYVDSGSLVKQQVADSGQGQNLDALTKLADARIAASVAAEPDGVRLKGVVLGSPENPDAEFTPKLDDKVPADAIAYVGFANLQSQVGTVLKQLESTGQGDMVNQLKAGSAQLPALLGVSLDDLKALTTKEHAVVVTKGTPMPGAVLALEVEDGARAQKTLDTLREKVPVALAQFAPTTNLPPWKQVTLEGGVQGWDLPVSPTGGVTYGVDGNLALLGTSPGAVRAVQRPVQPLSQLAEFTDATADMPDKVTGLAWINAGEALRLAEASGAYANNPAALANARKVKSVVAWSTGGAEPTFEVFVRIAK